MDKEKQTTSPDSDAQALSPHAFMAELHKYAGTYHSQTPKPAPKKMRPAAPVVIIVSNTMAGTQKTIRNDNAKTIT